MTRTTTSKLLLLLAAGASALLLGVACGGGGKNGDSGGDDDGTPTPTPVVNPYQVCVAHFEQDVGDAPEIANLLLVVLLNEYWVGAAQDVIIDGLSGALYADYHYNFDGPNPPEYVGAISTSGIVSVTSSSNALGTTAQLDIPSDPAWYLTTTAGTLSGGTGSVSGVLQALAACTGGTCDYGTGSAALLVNGSALTLATANSDTVALLYCRDLPSTFAGWRPGLPLPPGFRETFVGSHH